MTSPLNITLVQVRLNLRLLSLRHGLGFYSYLSLLKQRIFTKGENETRVEDFEIHKFFQKSKKATHPWSARPSDKGKHRG